MFENTTWNKKSYTLFKEYLFSLKDEKYRKFNQRTVPTININEMIGIRIPVIRTIAKDIIKGDYIGFLDICDNEYFEETMIEGAIIRIN